MPHKKQWEINVIIPFVLQLIPACVLIQVCLVHTDPQGSKEREKNVCFLYISQNWSAFICMEKPVFLHCGKPNGMGLSTAYARGWETQSFRWFMKRNSPFHWKVSKSCQMVLTLPVSFCLMKVFFYSIWWKFLTSFSLQMESAPGNTCQKRSSKYLAISQKVFEFNEYLRLFCHHHC